MMATEAVTKTATVVPPLELINRGEEDVGQSSLKGGLLDIQPRETY